MQPEVLCYSSSTQPSEANYHNRLYAYYGLTLKGEMSFQEMLRRPRYSSVIDPLYPRVTTRDVQMMDALKLQRQKKLARDTMQWESEGLDTNEGSWMNKDPLRRKLPYGAQKLDSFVSFEDNA